MRNLLLVVCLLGGATSAAAQTTTTPAPAPAQAPAPTVENKQAHDGVWFNIGFGYGSLGCNDCSGREGGLTGGLVIGGTVNQRLLLGFGTAGYVKDVEGETLTVGHYDLRMRFYPSRTNGFFLTGGVGLGVISIAGESEKGFGALLGLGYDIRVSKNVSITPFWNGYAMSNSTGDANVGQIGVGVTIH